MGEHAEADTGHEIERGDKKAGNGVALDEFRGTIEGTEERRFLLLLLAPHLRFFMADRADGEV